jgi:hypothetical protein
MFKKGAKSDRWFYEQINKLPKIYDEYYGTLFFNIMGQK